MKLRVQRNRRKTPELLLSALEARVEAFTAGYGKAAIETVKARYDCWIHFVNEEGNGEKANVVYKETARLIQEEHGGRVSKTSEVGKFCVRWEKQLVDVCRKSKRKNRPTVK